MRSLYVLLAFIHLAITKLLKKEFDIYSIEKFIDDIFKQIKELYFKSSFL